MFVLHRFLLYILCAFENINAQLTFLSHISVPGEDCEDNFTKFENFAAPNGQPFQELGSQVECVNECVGQPNCIAFNFNNDPDAITRLVVYKLFTHGEYSLYT